MLAFCSLMGGVPLAGSRRPRGKSWGSDSIHSIEVISRRGPFQRRQQGVSCSVLWSPCEGPPCLRHAISIQAACHRRERFHLETGCRGRPGPCVPGNLTWRPDCRQQKGPWTHRDVPRRSLTCGRGTERRQRGLPPVRHFIFSFLCTLQIPLSLI